MCLEHYRKLAEVLQAPPMFSDVLVLITREDEVDLLLKLSEGPQTINQVSTHLNVPEDEIQPKVQDLFRRGFLSKKRNGQVLYETRSFIQILGRHVYEGRTKGLKGYLKALGDYFLEEHVREGKNYPYPLGKVLPVTEALPEPVSIVLPYETAMNVLKRAKSFSLRNCSCRMTYRNCDSPLMTCLALDEFSDELVERGAAREVRLEQAEKVLTLANRHGLVQTAIYRDWLKGKVFDICNCCRCCCMYLRTLLNYGVKHHVAKSDLIAEVDKEKCSGCGTCLKRCVFNARILRKEKSFVRKDSCYGCGLCVTTCPTGASKLVSRPKSN